MELLSPAGNLELALAAFDGGADAVYCGLSGAFNARMRAENFTPETLGKLIRFANENSKKVYVTLNTLVKEDELGSLFETLTTLDQLHPDAIIVQDPGIIKVVKKYFPELKLHASTQMGIHNSAGVAAMEALGVSRVILERQITLDELKKISRQTRLELEVFIHGSLCCSLSGRCLLSGFLYDQSGNRGRCKQPCRRRYTTPQGNGFFLSPGDLCATTLLDELEACNVASLKIEGRLRSPDYVWKTARAYRMLLDAAPGERDAALREAENILSSALSRRKTLGFYDFPAKRALVDSRISGVFGTPAAKVEKITRRGVLVSTLSPLHLGDRLRFQPPQGGDGDSFSLTKMESAPGVRALKVKAGCRVFIPGDFSAGAKWQLLKIGENGFDFSRQAANLPRLRYPLDLKIDFSAEKFCLTLAGHTFIRECAFSPAEKHPLNAVEVEKCFSEGVPEPWRTGKISVNVDGKFFVPAAELKKMRREFWEETAQKLSLEEYFSFYAEKMTSFFEEVTQTPQTPAPAAEPDKKASFTLPAFVPEGELKELEREIEKQYRAGIRTFNITHWHGFTLLKPYTDVQINVLFPIPVCNVQAATLMQTLGITAAEAAPELDDAAFSALQKRSALPVFRSSGTHPLLVTRLPLPTGKWHDERNNRFTVRKNRNVYELYPAERLEI